MRRKRTPLPPCKTRSSTLLWPTRDTTFPLMFWGGCATSHLQDFFFHRSQRKCLCVIAWRNGVNTLVQKSCCTPSPRRQTEHEKLPPQNALWKGPPDTPLSRNKAFLGSTTATEPSTLHKPSNSSAYALTFCSLILRLIVLHARTPRHTGTHACTPMCAWDAHTRSDLIVAFPIAVAPEEAASSGAGACHAAHHSPGD